MSRISEAREKARRERAQRSDGSPARSAPTAASSPAPAPSTAPESRTTPEPPPSPESSTPSAPPKLQEVRPIDRPARSEPALETVATAVPHHPPDEHLVTLLDPSSHGTEQFRRLRHLIEQRHASGLSAIAVTSPTMGDGKSLVTINLAGALAHNSEARVLLIDADLRKPTVQSRLGLPRVRGLSQLHHSHKLHELVTRLEEYNLDVLPAGPPATNPYEILKSAAFEAIFDQARASYDYILVDTPPVLAAPDCRLFEERIDGYLLVICAHKTQERTIEDTLLELPPEKVLGVIFNRFDTRREYYSSYYVER